MKAVIYLMFLVGMLFGVGQAGRGIFGSVWDGKSQLVWVETQGERVRLRQWRPAEKLWRTIELPKDLVLPIAQGYGTYRVGALTGLDQLEKKQGELIVTGLEEALGMALDGDDTGLSWWDWLRLWVARGRSETIKFEEVVPVTEAVLPDGLKVKQVSEVDMNRFSSRFLADEAVRAEGVKVAILNGTGRAGLAGRLARIATNMGLVVVKVGETLPQQKSRLVVVPEKKNLISVRKLKNLLELKQREVGDTSDQRADVVILIGEDYWLRVGD